MVFYFAAKVPAENVEVWDKAWMQSIHRKAEVLRKHTRPAANESGNRRQFLIGTRHQKSDFRRPMHCHGVQNFCPDPRLPNMVLVTWAAETLLGAPGTATSNKCLTSSNKKNLIRIVITSKGIY